MTVTSSMTSLMTSSVVRSCVLMSDPGGRVACVQLGFATIEES